jgi:hypothetical protein
MKKAGPGKFGSRFFILCGERLSASGDAGGERGERKSP